MRNKKWTIPQMKELFYTADTFSGWNNITKKWVDVSYTNTDYWMDFDLWVHHKYECTPTGFITLSYYQRVKIMNRHLEDWLDFALPYIWNKRNPVWFKHAGKTYHTTKNFYMWGENGYEEFDQFFSMYLRGQKLNHLKNKINEKKDI